MLQENILTLLRWCYHVCDYLQEENEAEGGGGDYDYEDDIDEYDDDDFEDEEEDDASGSNDDNGAAENDDSKKKGGDDSEIDASTSENLSHLDDRIAPQQSVLHMTQAVSDIAYISTHLTLLLFFLLFKKSLLLCLLLHPQFLGSFNELKTISLMYGTFYVANFFSF